MSADIIDKRNQRCTLLCSQMNVDFVQPPRSRIFVVPRRFVPAECHIYSKLKVSTFVAAPFQFMFYLRF